MTTRLLIFALLLLQPAWYLWLAPPVGLPPVIAAVAMAAPMIPAALLALFGHRSAGFWGGVAALFYFSHGTMEWWSNPAVTALAATESALATALIFSASWRGLQARAAARQAAAQKAAGSEASE